MTNIVKITITHVLITVAWILKSFVSTFWRRGFYLFLVSVVINYHKLDNVKQQKLIPSQS